MRRRQRLKYPIGMAPLIACKLQPVKDVYDASFSQSVSHVSSLVYFKEKIGFAFGMASAFAVFKYIAMIKLTMLILIFSRFMVSSLQIHVHTHSLCRFIADNSA
jgi:hypothetical protein